VRVIWRPLNIILLLSCSCLALGFAVHKEEQTPPQYKAAVNLVVMDVVVTGKKGVYPADLRKEDFEVYEDGVRQNIQDFRRVQIEPVEATPLAEDRAPAARPSMSEPEPARLFLLMIDDLSSQWANLYQVSEALEKIIVESLVSMDLVAIATVSHSGGLLQTFTNDRQALLQAIRRALGLSTRGTNAAGAASMAIRYAEQAAPLVESACLYTGLPESMQVDTTAWRDAARIFSMQNDYSARGALYTLQSACRALGALKGRKTVILVSEGFGISDPVRAALPKVIDAANKANVAVYTINPRGLEQPDPVQLIRFTQPAQATTFASAGMVVAGNSSFDLLHMENRANLREDSLGELAASTGGVTLRNSNEFRKGLEQAVNDSHSYYELTYLPKNQALDGKFRKIEVRLRPRLEGYTVRARGGYYAAGSAAGMAGSAEAQMSQALYDANPVNDLETAIAPAIFADPQGKNLARMTLTLRPESVTLRNEGGRQSAGFKLLASVFNERGAIVSDYRQDYRLSLDESTLPGFLKDGATLVMNFGLPPGRYQIKTVAREISSGRMGTQRSDFEVTPFDAGGAQMSTIVLVRQQLAAGQLPGKTDSGEAYEPLRMGGIVLVPSMARSYPREGYLTAFFHVYHVGDPDDPGKTRYHYQMSLYRDETLFSQSDPKSVRSEIRHPLRGFLLAPRLSLSALPPGNYRLEVEVALPDGRDRISRSVSFQVQ